MIRAATAIALFATICTGAAPAIAQEPTTMQDGDMVTMEARAQAVADVLGGNGNAADVFSSAFLAQVPEERLIALITQLEGQYGPYLGLEGIAATGPGPAIISFRFENGRASGPIAFDAQGLVQGLRLTQMEALNDGFDEIAADLAALPGTVGVYYASLDSDADTVLALGDTEHLAIGSAFKLYVLSTLARSIEAGERNWADVVPLTARSFPSGQMQDWPQGAPVTLHTLASLMISVSDNTATDQLIAVLGREAVEAELRASGHSDPDATLPFLSTFELFALKGDSELGATYAKEGYVGRTRLLKNLRGRTPDTITLPTFTEPTMIDTLEWFASGRDLAGIMKRLHDIEDPTARAILAISPALTDAARQNWAYAGFKGGSEPGVLNLTWLLEDEVGVPYVLAMSWNDTQAEVDQKALELLSMRILALEPRPGMRE